MANKKNDEDALRKCSSLMTGILFSPFSHYTEDTLKGVRCKWIYGGIGNTQITEIKVFCPACNTLMKSMSDEYTFMPMPFYRCINCEKQVSVSPEDLEILIKSNIENNTFSKKQT